MLYTFLWYRTTSVLPEGHYVKIFCKINARNAYNAMWNQIYQHLTIGHTTAFLARHCVQHKNYIP